MARSVKEALYGAERMFREALEGMVYQFGYRGVKGGEPIISTGGNSALEQAFEALGWEDPLLLPEEGFTCEILGCMEEDTCGTTWGDLYLRLCSKHYQDSCQGKARPEVKAYALARESTRDKETGRLP